ncbi:hypothetical protein HDU88_001580, partial [Geranomyces variabilis]
NSKMPKYVRVARGARPTFKSKRPEDKIQYHLNGIQYNACERLFDKKKQSFYFGPNRNKLNYVLQKIEYHLKGLKSYSNYCIAKLSNDIDELRDCACITYRTSVLLLVETFVQDMANLSSATDAELQDLLKEFNNNLINLIDDPNYIP